MVLQERTRLLWAVAGVVILANAPLATAVQEPGTEYALMVDEPNSWCHMALGDPNDTVPLAGWFSVYLGEPTGANWNVPCTLGKCYVENTEDLDLVIFPGAIEAHIPAGDLRILDMDIWYSDPDDWLVDPNDYPDPNEAVDPNDAPDPNNITPGDPNDPTYNDPNDPNYNRWVDLTGGPPTSSGILNSEVLYYWKFWLILGAYEEGAGQGWSAPFGPWTVDATYTGDPNNPIKVTLDWYFWIVSSDFPVFGHMHIEGYGNVARKLELTIKNADKGMVGVDPDVKKYVSAQDSKTQGLYKFPETTAVTLTAIPTTGSFKEWTIFDPNYPGDRGHAVTDTNLVLSLTMDNDWEIEAAFKCGSSEMIMPLGLVLLALTAAVVRRKLL